MLVEWIGSLVVYLYIMDIASVTDFHSLDISLSRVLRYSDLKIGLVVCSFAVECQAVCLFVVSVCIFAFWSIAIIIANILPATAARIFVCVVQFAFICLYSIMCMFCFFVGVLAIGSSCADMVLWIVITLPNVLGNTCFWSVCQRVVLVYHDIVIRALLFLVVTPGPDECWIPFIFVPLSRSKLVFVLLVYGRLDEVTFNEELLQTLLGCASSVREPLLLNSWLFVDCVSWPQVSFMCWSVEQQ